MTESLKEKHIKQIWDKAKHHYNASKVGIPSDFEKYEVCNCCDQPVIKQQIQMSQHTKEFQIFGFGYPLYFSFLKYCILLVLILIATRTSTSMYMATKQNYAFCYGNNHESTQTSQHGQNPHHSQNLKGYNFDHLSLRHLEQNQHKLKLQHKNNFNKINHHNKQESILKQASSEQSNPQTKPQNSSTKLQQPQAKPQQPLTKPLNSSTKPLNPLTKPQNPLGKPQQQQDKLQQPQAKLQQTPTKPLNSSTVPQHPPAKPLNSSTIPLNSSTKPLNSSTKPLNPLTKPQNPLGKPQQQQDKLQQPQAKLQQTPTKPLNSSTVPQHPPAKPLNSSTIPLNSSTKPLNSSTKPLNPLTKPQNPLGKPQQQQDKLQQLQAKLLNSSTIPLNQSTIPLNSSTIPQHPPAKPLNSSTKPLNSSTKPQHPSTKSQHPSTKSQHPSAQSSQHPSAQSSQHEAHHLECTSFMIYLSIFKGQEQYNNIFLRVIGFLMHIIALIGIRNMLLKEEQYYDQRICSLSDYSIMISNLPQIQYTGEMVKRMLKEDFEKQQQVKQLIYIFENQKIKKHEQQMEKLQQKKLQTIETNNQNQMKEVQKQMHHLQKDFDAQMKSLKSDIEKGYIKCDKIIVIMNTEQDKGDVLESYQKFLENGQKNIFRHFQNVSGNGQKPIITIKQAAEPNQIIWQHIDESDLARKALIFRGWVFTILFLMVVTVVFYFIMLAKTNLFVHAVELQHHDPNNPSVKNNKIFATIIVFAALFGVILFNKFVMGKVLHKFVHMERHAYTDKQGFSFAMKYSLGMFFTTALMTLAVEAITFKNFYSHQYGVIEQQTIMFFVTAFFIPLVWLIHPYNLAKKFELSMHQNTLVTQQKANELIEDFEYDLGKRYAQIFEIMWFTFLYSQLIPLGSFLIVIGLSLYYWVDKYNFLRRSALKQGLSGKISIISLKALDATLFLAHFGRVLFSYILQDDIDYLGIGMTVLGLIYLLIPISDLIWFFNQQKFILQSKTYDQAKYQFKQHYYTLHPVYKMTHKAEIEKFRKKVIDHCKLSYAKSNQFAAGRGKIVSSKNIQSDANTSHHGSRIIS